MEGEANNKQGTLRVNQSRSCGKGLRVEKRHPTGELLIKCTLEGQPDGSVIEREL